MVCENLREDDDIILQSENGIPRHGTPGARR